MRDNELLLEISNFFSDVHNVVQPLLVVNLALVEGTFLNLDLFVQQGQLLVPLDELRAQDVPLVDDHLVVFLLLLLFRLGLADDVLESGNVALLRLDHLFGAFDVSLDFLLVRFQLLVLLLMVLLAIVFMNDRLVLRGYFFLELGNVLSHSPELHPELCNFLLGLQKVL